MNILHVLYHILHHLHVNLGYVELHVKWGASRNAFGCLQVRRGQKLNQWMQQMMLHPKNKIERQKPFDFAFDPFQFWYIFHQVVSA